VEFDDRRAVNHGACFGRSDDILRLRLFRRRRSGLLGRGAGAAGGLEWWNWGLRRGVAMFLPVEHLFRYYTRYKFAKIPRVSVNVVRFQGTFVT
jgi:hypothetical protein